MSKTRRFSVCLLIAAFIAVCACNMEQVGRYPADWLMYHIPAEPDTLNPLTSTDLYSDTILESVYETLVWRNPDTLELEPRLAESWEISPDGMVITFHMRKDVRFTDGVPATARDVEYTYRKIMDPKVDCPHLRNYYADISKVEVLDDYTIKFTYKEPYFRALEICGYTQCIPKHLFEKSGDFNKSPLGRAPVGTGPYKFVEWITGRNVTLDRNEDYWRAKPEIKRVEYKFISLDSTALIELKKRHLDVMGLRPIQWVKQTNKPKFLKSFRKEMYYLPNYNYIGWNMRRPLFSDKLVRRAMTMLVDRDTILNTILFGLGKVVTGPAYIYSPYYDSDIKPWPYNPNAAKQLLDQAGWSDHDGDGIRDKNGMPFKFEFLISSGSVFADQLGTILQRELAKAEIKMEVRKLEWATFLKMVDDRNFDAVTLGWSLGVETDPYQLWHSSQIEKGSNFVGFSNPEADAIIVKNRRTFDVNERIRLMKRFHAILHDEQPYTFLFCSPSLVAINKRFENVKVHKLGLDIREWTINRQWKGE